MRVKNEKIHINLTVFNISSQYFAYGYWLTLLTQETVIERLKKGLLNEFLRNYVKQQLIERSSITVDKLEEELCQMEESTADQTKVSVLLNERLMIPEHNQTLSMEQWQELRAHQMLASGGTGTISFKLPLLTPQDRAMNEWTAQLDALTRKVDAIGELCEVLRGIAGTGQPLPGLTSGLPIGLNPGDIPVTPQAG